MLTKKYKFFLWQLTQTCLSFITNTKTGIKINES